MACRFATAIGSSRSANRTCETQTGPGLNLVAPQNFLDWRAQQTAFTGLAAIGYASVSLKAEGGQEPETLEAQAVTADFFPVLGTAPLIGRTFTADNEVERASPRRGHQLRPLATAVRRRTRRDRPPPAGPARGLRDSRRDAALPSRIPSARPARPRCGCRTCSRPRTGSAANEFSYRLQVIGRLRDGVSIEQAQAQMDQITARLAAETPRWFEDRVAKVEPLRDYLTRGVRTWMFMLLGRGRASSCSSPA